MKDSNQDDLNHIESSDDNARQLLELELQKIRSEASAARLDARAAEIEIVIGRLRANQSSDELTTQELEGQRLRVDAQSSDQADFRIGTKQAPESVPRNRFASWNDLRSAQLVASGAIPIATNADQLTDPVLESEPILRFDGPHSFSNSNSVPSHHLPLASSEFADGEVGECEVDSFQPDQGEVEELQVEELGGDESPSLFTTEDAPRPLLDHESIEMAGQLSETWSVDEEPEHKRRGKPAAVLVSAVVHVGILLVLAGMALQIHSPKDQVALTASASSSEEMAMESFSIENVDEPEPETEVAEPTPAETEYEVSPIGEFKATDFATDAIASPVSSMAAAMTSQGDPTVKAMMLKSDSVSKMKFCGVEGGGNHFVYLVDSSGSMGDAFESARRELLASIDLLSPDQRFYVVFFDSKPDFMRISNPGVDEARSVYATTQNKAALRRWAMRISMDRGKAPYDPLTFALGLKADVIFLLSDGEFPEGIPELLKEENRVENLFGESKPISIVHTISYFSKEGANIMTRIAKQNQGQYRHVPKP